ncbi:hypothetical protein QWE_11157 [Agrobacterium albertimagni AOL15]|uniref:Heparan-alpha-glucosaminide N-acetyltransferase catalytic domain-containing protein n=1 Tax=Agrobacterium albertimagni AOL15 TaxID=1156935 RepID=K2PFZ5_9HYPH|nr:hypothetical protein QWE_11157 [Agrobacterium albertimagni AOL15]
MVSTVVEELKEEQVADPTERPIAPTRPRLLALDAARGLALIAMATYHFSWDLEFFGYLAPGTSTQGFLRIYARLIASTFLFLAGFSLVLAQYPTWRLEPFLRRLGVIVAAAAAISVATYWFTPDSWIFFGILHAIALSSVIGLLFLKAPPLVTLLAAGLAFALPAILRSPAFDAWYFWFLGLSETLPRSNDYVPLLPWIGALLTGIAVARFLVDGDRLGWIARLPAGPRWLRWGGRHSLTVYLLHQPVLIAGLYLASFVIPAPALDPVASYIGSCEASCLQQGNDSGLCERFCSCTLERLQAENLLDPLQSGANLDEQNARIQTLAEECTIRSQPAP